MDLLGYHTALDATRDEVHRITRLWIHEPIFLDNEQDLEPFILDLEEPIEFENEFEPVSPEAIRELAVTAAQDARFALERLAAAGIV